MFFQPISSESIIEIAGRTTTMEDGRMPRMAYCSQKVVRLPSDAELLTAMIIDDEVHDFSRKEKLAAYNSGRVVKGQGHFLTATVKNDEVVLRNGPWVAKYPGWADKEHPYRTVIRQQECVGQLYICI